MRQLTAHRAAEADKQITINVLGQPNAAGAFHDYRIDVDGGDRHVPSTAIHFQEGPIQEAGVNGITIESLLAICAHRLQCFQEGAFPSDENEHALHHVHAALKKLHQRTLDRRIRAVEGTNQK